MRIRRGGLPPPAFLLASFLEAGCSAQHDGVRRPHFSQLALERHDREIQKEGVVIPCGSVPEEERSALPTGPALSKMRGHSSGSSEDQRRENIAHGR
jgi:hypothetical protein